MQTTSGAGTGSVRRIELSLAVLFVLLTVGVAVIVFQSARAAFAADSGCEASTPYPGDQSTAPDPEIESETLDEAQAGPATVSEQTLAQKRAEFSSITRPAFWRNESVVNPSAYSPADLARIQQGLPPIGKDGYPMELHHIQPLSQGGSNDPSNLRPMTRTAHRLGPNFRLNHPLQGCPDLEPNDQRTPDSSAGKVIVQENYAQATTVQVCFGDGTPCQSKTIPRGAGVFTYPITHPYATIGDYTQRATLSEYGSYSEAVTHRVATC